MADHYVVTFADAVLAHAGALRMGGGVPGINSRDLIESALGRPYHEYAGTEFYPSLMDKAGCLLHGFLNNHGFRDANKRTAWIMCNAFLYEESALLTLPKDYPWYERLAQMVDEHWTVDDVIAWVKSNGMEFEDRAELHRFFREFDK